MHSKQGKINERKAKKTSKAQKTKIDIYIKIKMIQRKLIRQQCKTKQCKTNHDKAKRSLSA